MEDGEGTEESIGGGSGVDEGEDGDRDEDSRHGPLSTPQPHVVLTEKKLAREQKNPESQDFCTGA